MADMKISMTISGAGLTISQDWTRTADGPIGCDPTVSTAKALSSWVNTDDDTAAGTLAGGHGWASGKGDVYWTGGRRYDVDITISTNDVTLDGGTGDAFPATANATVVLAMHQQVNLAIDGDLVEAVAFMFESTSNTSTARGHIHAEDAAGDVIADLDFIANKPRLWDIEGGQTNTFTGDPIATLFITMDSATETVKFKTIGVQDVTP